MDFKIDKEFQSLIPPLQLHEYQQLEENILSEGCTHPIDVWEGTIVDGHNRYKICKEHDIPFEYTNKEFEDRDAVKVWIIKNQFGRRNLIPFQRAELALVLKPLIAAKAKERKMSGLKQNHTVPEISKEREPKGETAEKLAEISGISSNSIRRAEVIKNKGTPEQLERARTGGQGNSINAIYTEIRHQGISEKFCPMCKKTLPIDRFYGEGATCKTCTEFRKQEGLILALDETKQKRKDAAPNLAETINMIYECATDLEKEIDYTAEDFIEEMSCVNKDYISKLYRMFSNHNKLSISDSEKQKMVAALFEVEAAIRKIKELI